MIVDRRFARAGTAGALCCFLLPVLAGAGRAEDAPVPFALAVLDSGGAPYLKTTGDLDGDGRTDLVIGRNAGGLVWYGNPGWARHVIAEAEVFGTDGETADVDNDGDLDLVALTGSGVVWYENPAPARDPATGLWRQHRVAADELHDIEAVDLDRDGRVDLVGRNQGAFGGIGATLYLWT